MPKKLLVYASRFADEFAAAAGFGWTVEPPRFDWPTLVEAKNREIARLSAAYRAGLDSAGATLIEERATVVDRHTLRLSGGRTISARHILVATGARPEPPADFPGLELAITSNEIFDLPAFPQRLLVVGGGYIAVEFACLFAKLGAEVTQVMRADNVLRGFDEDMREGLRDELERAGVRLRFGSLPTRFERRGEALLATLSDGGSLTVDQALVATGRRPNTAGLGLEAAGVALDVTGAVVVDDRSTSNVAVDPRGRRRHQSHQSDPGGDPRRPGARRPFVRRRQGRRRPLRRRQRRLRHAGDRRGRTDRGRSAAAL